jgi:uncharacterized membrane protein (DUF2068 family)
MTSSQRKLLRLIAVFKLLKAVLLIAVAAGAVHLLHSDIANMAEHWVRVSGLYPGHRYLGVALRKISSLTPNRIRELALGSVVYAALFLTEGIGLWFLKRWAEWVTVIITSSLVPIEVYGIYRHPTPVRVVALGLNIAVIWYLVRQIYDAHTS